jgi:hypothetical protein
MSVSARPDKEPEEPSGGAPFTGRLMSLTTRHTTPGGAASRDAGDGNEIAGS